MNVRRHCGIRGCRCTHDDPCDYGWIDAPPLEQNGQTYDRVAPCPTCRPGAYGRMVDRLERNSR